MARILIHMLREHGHVLPTLKLARGLTAAGHRVEYLLTPWWHDFCAAQGVTLRPYLEHIFPAAAEAAWTGMDQPAREADAERRRDARVQWLLAGGLDAVYRAAAPDLILGDVYDVSIPIVARRLGIRVGLLSPTCFQGREPGVPPLSSAVRWGTDAPARAAAEAEWARLAEQRQREADDWYPRYVEALLAVYGFPREEFSWEGAIAPDFPRLPQLILGPRAFEFPRMLPGRCHDDVASVSPAAATVGPELQEFLQRRPLVYCALGSQGLWRPQYAALLDQVLRLARRRPELSFVIAGDATWADRLAAAAPANARVLAWAPQQAVLGAASVMISVGGMGTIKECLQDAVPLVLAPQFNPFDAQGNAARAAHHGLGEVLAAADDSGEGLEAAVDRALAGRYTEALGRMQAEMQRVEAGDRGVVLVERWLGGDASLAEEA
ncbi:glycosyltransferase [Nannocystis bainbridge]|uniref:Glycosyltransferase n=1 Tax=Nannocystis bainbridge TaxID=2995303 RepID=A0ABT5EEH7_9BACT|nr:glycosyltransferase [Nannocystis bainbridge]MDC0723729.1 glycosyltransferase [Nannocystis bainbridge]